MPEKILRLIRRPFEIRFDAEEDFEMIFNAEEEIVSRNRRQMGLVRSKENRAKRKSLKKTSSRPRVQISRINLMQKMRFNAEDDIEIREGRFEMILMPKRRQINYRAKGLFREIAARWGQFVRKEKSEVASEERDVTPPRHPGHPADNLATCGPASRKKISRLSRRVD